MRGMHGPKQLEASVLDLPSVAFQRVVHGDGRVTFPVLESLSTIGGYHGMPRVSGIRCPFLQVFP